MPPAGASSSKTLGAKALAIRGAGRRRHGHAWPEDAAARQALPDAAILELARLGRRVAELFGAPQDIEWAWAGGRLYLLQSRPITIALSPAGRACPPSRCGCCFPLARCRACSTRSRRLGRTRSARVLLGAGRLFGVDLTLETQPVLWAAGERLVDQPHRADRATALGGG